MDKYCIRLAVILMAVILLFAGCPHPTPPAGKDPEVTFPLGTISIIGSAKVGEVLSVDLSGLDADLVTEDEIIYYEWIVGGIEAAGPCYELFTYTIQPEDAGKTIAVRVQGVSWELQFGGNDDLWVRSAEIGPVIRGWAVKTIATFLPHATEAGNRDQRFQYDNDDPRRGRTLAIDSTGKLYIGANVEYVGWKILQVDPKVYDAEWGQVKVKVFADEDGGSIAGAAIQGIAVGPNDSVYTSLLWGKDRGDGHFVVRFDQPGGSNVSGGSGNIFQKLIDMGYTVYSAAGGNPYGDVTVDHAGNMFVIVNQWGDARDIVKVTPAGAVSRFAGGNKGKLDGIGTNAQFNDITGMTVDPTGNVYVADGYSDGKIRMINGATRQVSTFAGAVWGGPFVIMGGLTYGRDGNFYVIDRVSRNEASWGPVIRKIDPATRAVTALAGDPNRKGQGNNSSGVNPNDGMASEALFLNPYGIAVDTDGTVYVMDTWHDYVWTGSSYEFREYACLRMYYYDG